MAAARNPSRGFTLVEVLVALTLMGLVLGSIYSGLYGASRAWSRSESLAWENDLARIRVQLLRRLVSETVPITRLDGQAPHLLFQGHHDSLQFVAPLPSHAGGLGLYWSALELTRSNTGESQLSLTYSPLRPDVTLPRGNVDPDTETVVLATGVTQLELAYFGTPEGDLPPRWYDTWPEGERLPVLVRLTLHRAPGTGITPDLIVPIRTPALRGQPQWTLHAPQGLSG